MEMFSTALALYMQIHWHSEANANNFEASICKRANEKLLEWGTVIGRNLFRRVNNIDDAHKN
jgi:hypothetical protein